MPRARGIGEGKDTVTDFVDPLEEPFAQDRDPRPPLDPDLEEELVESADADRQAAEEGTSPGASPDARDGSEVTSASEGDPLDETTPVDNLE
ncbi:hypothetical protein [Agromyces sp. NPDC057865]|uniref:hypothetical protein n=1 Tax=Agromyces sp. NPDC057865 TaxID=3346267 RepID=UPI00366E3655